MKLVSRLCLVVGSCPSRAAALAQRGRASRRRRSRSEERSRSSSSDPDAARQQRAGVARGALGPGALHHRRSRAARPTCWCSPGARPGGEIRNGPVMFYGGWLVVLVLVAILAFYFAFGPVKLHEPADRPADAPLQPVDQVVHWSVAISFCVLGLSGLIMFFGKHVLLPIIGYTLFALAHRAVEEPAQLRRAAVHRFGDRDDGAVRAPQPAKSYDSSSWSTPGNVMAKRQARPVGQVQRRREGCGSGAAWWC